MKKIIKLFLSFFVILTCFLVLSCASINNSNSLSPVYVTNSKKVELISPEGIENNIDSLQLLNASFGKQSFSMLAFIRADETGIFISIMNDLGTDMGSLSYDGKSAVLDSAVFPKALKAEYIIADIQFAFYKPVIVEETLSNVGLSLVVENNGSTESRKIMDKDKCISEIIKTENECKIVNNLRGYEYTLLESE